MQRFDYFLIKVVVLFICIYIPSINIIIISAWIFDV